MTNQENEAREGYLTGDAPEGPAGVGREGAGRDNSSRDLAGALPAQVDPSNSEMVGTDPVDRAPIAPDTGVGADFSDITAPASGPVEPARDDDPDRNPALGLDNTRANF